MADCPRCNFGGKIMPSGLCFSCEQETKLFGVGPSKILFSRFQLFGDEERERDNIIWRIAENTIIWPIYHMTVTPSDSVMAFKPRLSSDADGMGQVIRAVSLERPFYCHDTNLHATGVLPAAMSISSDFASAMRNLGLTSVADIFQARRVGRFEATYAFEQLYAYEFHKAACDPFGWVQGFLVHSKDVLAHDVDFEEIDDANVLTPAA